MDTRQSPTVRSSGSFERWFGIGALLLALAEITLCFAGPLSFLQKPSLLLFPLYSSGLSPDEAKRANEFAEREIARTRAYAVVGHRMIVEYYVRTNPDFDRSKIETVDFATAKKIAGELGMKRFATGWIYRSSDRCELSLNIWDQSGEAAIRRGMFAARDFDQLMRGIGIDGRPFDFRAQLEAPVKGVGMTEALVLLVFALQALVGLLALARREVSFLSEIVWAALSVLFLFTYIYATNANMDYMQRYIATTGQLRLAENTTTERLYALVRYLPSLLLLGAAWLVRSIRCAPRLPEELRPVLTLRQRFAAVLRRLVGCWPLPLTILSAGLFGLSFPSLVSLEGIGPLAWVALVPLHLVLVALQLRRAIFHGVYFGILQALFVNYWHGTYDYVTLHMISMTMIAEYLVFMVVLVLLLRAAGKWGFLVAPLVWVVFDWARSSGVLGYPWGIAGTSQYRFLPFIQLASIGGIWWLDFLVILANASIAWFIGSRVFGWRWGGGRLLSRLRPGVRRAIACCLPLGFGIVVLGSSLLVGGSILARTRAAIAEARKRDPMTVVLVQPNCDPRKNPYTDNLDVLTSLTNRGIEQLGHKPDLVVWPEGAIMLDLRYWTDPERSGSYWGRTVRRFLDYQRSIGTWLLTGTQDHGTAMELGKRVPKDFNSSILLDPQGGTSALYHKIRLVPFGEYFPLSKIRFKKLYDQFKKYDISDWGIGERRVVFDHPKARFSTPICFEDVFPDHVRRYVAGGAQLIVNMSNDYWSLSPVEGRQHGILALFRAVENRRPLLRTTASGYTVSVDATGRIEPGSPEPYTSGMLVAQVAVANLPTTLYTRWGDWFPALAAVILALYILAVLVRAVYLRVSARLQRGSLVRAALLTVRELHAPRRGASSGDGRAASLQSAATATTASTRMNATTPDQPKRIQKTPPSVPQTLEPR